MNQPITDPNLLQDVEEQLYLEPASKGLRFANYVIDVLVFYALIFISGFVYAFMIVSRGEQIEDSALVQANGAPVFMQYLIGMVIIVGYYTIFEGATKGRTLGKLITGTQAVKEDGNNITWKDAFIRSLCRLVPFEPFSAFGDLPWHDNWTKTIVIKKVK